MAGRIPQAFIDETLSKTDIVELIGHFVSLKKKGKNFSACCPFHNEKTPSFSVAPDKQFYYCFGCHKSGNAISFLMEHERLEFLEALEYLADKAGLMMPERIDGQTEQRVDHTDDYALMERTAKFYQAHLKANPGAIDYLKRRGLSGETAATFRLGYAPDEWDVLTRHVTPAQRQQLETLGLLIKKQGGHYDRFRGRIIFPILDVRGHVIGFGGRILDKGEPKYLNSPETPLFHKRSQLYGLYQARQYSQLTRLLVVEGYMDVIALSQYGQMASVAALGTAFTDAHARLAFRYARELAFCFDGDNAGREAALRAAVSCLPCMREGRIVRLVLLPDGEDPDSYIQNHGKEAFERLCDQSQSLADYLLSYLTVAHDIKTVEGRANAVHQAKKWIEQMVDPIYQQCFIDGLSHALALNLSQLTSMLATEHRPDHQPSVQVSAQQVTSLSKPAQDILGKILKRPDLVAELKSNWAQLSDDKAELSLIKRFLQQIIDSDINNSGIVLAQYQGTEYEALLKQLLVSSEMLDESLWVAEIDEQIQALLKQNCDQRMNELLNQAKTTTLTDAEKRELNTLIMQSKL